MSPSTKYWLAALAALTGAAQAQNAANDPSSFVNLFIGVTNGGHVFPGATLPHGMAKAGMDTDSPGAQAGYDADPQFNVVGFSSLHDSGTGGGISLSHFKIFPTLNCPNGFDSCLTSANSRKVPRKLKSDGTVDDFASPGYFSTNLTNGVRVELTAASRASLQRHTFPAPNNASQIPRINVDVTNAAGGSATTPLLGINGKSGRVTAAANFQASFGPGRYNVFGCVEFARETSGRSVQPVAPIEWGVWQSNTPLVDLTDAKQIYLGFGSEVGGLLGFRPTSSKGETVLLVRTGVSFISTDQACANAAADIPHFDFDGTAAAARASWNDLLGRVQVQLGNQTDQQDMRKLLYSSLYRTHIVPADYSGENPAWQSTEPYYDSFYCNWDTFRTLYPLMSLHDPERFALIVRGMINIQQHEGWIPECRGATQQQYIQGGSDGDPILGEFFVKYVNQSAKLGVNPADLYNALLASAENLPPDWNLMGRQADVWKEFGYLPADLVAPNGAPTKEVSRALEYAFGDFAISQVAKILGNTADAEKYVGRAGNFVNNWDPNVTVPGGPKNITGMMQLRLLNGSFMFTDPRHCSVNDPTHSTCFLDARNMDGFYESSPLTYSQFVPQDMAKLVELQGGPAAFIERLNFIIDEGYFDVTDEPGQQIPFMYHYADRPGLSTARSRAVISEFFNLTIDGLPGNDDSGAMGSYAFFYLAGLYPVPATRQYLLASPFFPEISFFNPVFNTTATIRATNFAGNDVGAPVFVQNVTINGEPWHSNCFLEWDVFESGATVELTLTEDDAVACGADDSALPPSLSTGGFDVV
ncbi:glycoside hydrolase family 92 protein [Vararia minispora EC-137]|uniref:Glycoside hydrolase family 92 protein n=1 Tax=Vararia minispora EC-137 TaxID=1314806 RepID=A0ACB8QGZ0_9AGAM|nr:glycoside hydrolase family 92 protein [Vararia minispora EC-137]